MKTVPAALQFVGLPPNQTALMTHDPGTEGNPWLVIFRPCRQSNVLGHFRVLGDDCKERQLA